MTMFCFVRHGEADWRLADESGLVGAQRDFVPLTPDGIRQSETVSLDPRLSGAQLILSSPYTRALQTAAIINGRLRLPVVVENDLREWIPDRSFGITSSEQVQELASDYEACGGYARTRRFYEKSGFALCDEVDPYPGWDPGNPCAIYVKAL